MIANTIGVSTWCLQQLTFSKGVQLQEMIELVASMDVDALDLYDEYIPCYPNVNLYELNEIKKMTSAAGLQIASTWFFNDVLGSYFATSLNWTVENTKKFIAITAALDAKYMAIPFLLNVPGIDLEEAYDSYRRVFEKLLPTAEEYGIYIAAETARQHTPGLALRLHKALASEFFTICPDLEAWRFDTPDLPLVHQESDKVSEPEPLNILEECLPYSPLIHYKLLSIDAHGEEPHFPIPEIMDLINDSPINHHLCIEYEGWIPDIKPDADAVVETRKCVELVKRYLK